MNILPISTDLSSFIKNPLENVIATRSTGMQLKHNLGLDKFNYVMLQKVLDISIHMYIITVDSRRPTVYLSPFRVKSEDFSKVKRIKKRGNEFLMKDFKTSIPIQIEKTSPIVGTNTVIIFRDLAGAYLLNANVYSPMTEDKDQIIMDYNLE